jgi:integrase
MSGKEIKEIGWQKLRWQDALIFSLAIYSGLRSCEVSSLRWADVAEGRGVRTWFLPSKTKKENQMPCLMNPVSRALLEGRERVGEYVLGRKYRRESIWRLWGKIQVRAWGVRIYRFHDLRHTAITEFYRETRDLELTRQFARHKSYSSTIVYVHVVERERIESAVEKLAWPMVEVMKAIQKKAVATGAI